MLYRKKAFLYKIYINAIDIYSYRRKLCRLLKKKRNFISIKDKVEDEEAKTAIDIIWKHKL